MTTEAGDQAPFDISQLMTKRLRIVRYVRRDGSGQEYEHAIIFQEQLQSGQESPPMDAAYLRHKIPGIGLDRICSISEDAKLNAVANRIFFHLRGRMDHTVALREVRDLIILSYALWRR